MINLEEVSSKHPELPKDCTEDVDVALANNAHYDQTKKEIIDYYHRCALCPRMSTRIESIDKDFCSTWPGITNAAVRKHIPKAVATAKGHMSQKIQGIKSTKTTTPTTPLTKTPTECHHYLHKYMFTSS